MKGAWLVDQGSPDITTAFRISRLLHEEQTAYQHLEIYESPAFGRMLVLDGAVQTTEREEFIYHEMLVHPALCTHPAPKRVLIVGGGDGGALEEALKHPLDRATLVEIDEAVVRTSRQYLPGVAGRAFDDPRASVVIGDGIAYAAETPARFDVVLVDSTDPQGPATGLFSPDFYGTIARRLTPGGIVTVQSGSAIYQRDLIRSVRRTLRPFFPIVRTYVAAVVEYPGTLWSFTLGSLGPDPLALAQDAIARRTEGFGLRYYTPDGHHAAFSPPPFLRDATESSE
jgi:spermidine synthase